MLGRATVKQGCASAYLGLTGWPASEVSGIGFHSETFNISIQSSLFFLRFYRP